MPEKRKKMRIIRTAAPLFFVIISAFLVASFYHNVFHVHLRHLSPSSLSPSKNQNPNLAIREDLIRGPDPSPLRAPPDSILFHDWEVLVVLPENPFPSSASALGHTCLFQDGAASPALPAGVLPRGARATFKCRMPFSVRRLRPFFTPALTRTPEILRATPAFVGNSPEMLRWSSLAYESISTEDDVIVFAKGVNGRQGVNVPPSALRCIFGNGVTTAVTSSVQEVFRCGKPDRPIPGDEVKITLEIRTESVDRAHPSVALYAPRQRTLAAEAEPALICACTMMYNSGKFLREWVMYHATIGVERFVLYDNGSDDDMADVVEKLLEAGYHVTTILWPWPKTQEAGFSHCAVSYRDTCKWMAFVDVDEFIFSPSWTNASQPSKHMLESFLPKSPSSSSSPSPSIGQIALKCFEFGPSNRQSHPKEGVTQGYTCRRRIEQRHKSIVLLDAIDSSLVNVVHHFKLKDGYRTLRLSREVAAVNHYKYQAWLEFKKKFRRRVSAYVVDWRNPTNLASKDRTPGLGNNPIEPVGWAGKFCEVNDSRLRDVNRQWFGLESPTGYKLAWEDG
ncbi:glycosyltransferase family 92 protein RCOM_0530710 [Magnolia sinica]|uniref:glycosyltransferase family 92 protein RCOM_0530710 n=1 Tax=Magnolia sinica TaxID=86752 RepID=UPI0026592603|nr:glycosyltransferase family 92 protein RCOM_0530710 [Magnolia sinica]